MNPDDEDAAAEIVAAVLEELGEDLGERGVREELVAAVQVIMARTIASAVEVATDQVAMEMGEMAP